MPYIGNVPAEAYSQVSYQDLTGGSGTSFTLDYPVGSAGEIEVFVNNVRQEPTVAYTVSGTSLTMTGSISATDDFYVVFQGKAQQTIGIPEKQTDGTYLFPDDITVNGDLTVDTNTLHVDSANNRVGVGTASPAAASLQIKKDTASTTNELLRLSNSAGSTTDGVKLVMEVANTSGNGGEIGAVRDGGSFNPYMYFSTSAGVGSSPVERMRINSSGNVGIGTASPATLLDVRDGVGSILTLGNSGTFTAGESSYLKFREASTQLAEIGWEADTNELRINNRVSLTSFYTANTERARIDSSGNLLVGTTDANPGNNSGGSDVGSVLDSNGKVLATANGAEVMVLNRQSSDGDIVQLRKDGTVVGRLGTQGSYLHIEGSTAGAYGLKFVGSSYIRPSKNDGLTSDNELDLGTPTARFDDIYATNGTIQTSDRNEKQQIASLTDAEITAAKAISKLFKTFKWNDKVAEKGDAARTHAGVIAQDVQQAMTDADLDAGNYAFFISSTWYEDADGNEVEADTEGAIERTRLGIRYPELLAFIGAATEQRLASIEARLDALETP